MEMEMEMEMEDDQVRWELITSILSDVMMVLCGCGEMNLLYIFTLILVNVDSEIAVLGARVRVRGQFGLGPGENSRD